VNRRGETNRIGHRVHETGSLHVVAAREVLDYSLDPQNLPVLLIPGLSTPPAPKQRAAIRSRWPFLIGVHEFTQC
jgi:hypothetical protein